eukprot:9502090-Pyramimonas_sp.AAC.1
MGPFPEHQPVGRPIVPIDRGLRGFGGAREPASGVWEHTPGEQLLGPRRKKAHSTRCPAQVGAQNIPSPRIVGGAIKSTMKHGT